ncbi:hypothetical protein jhhlp_001735 [Lomentospora prolificans]|uniref:AIG1-type G domain-containing protein n=1 Tax=Lomentospora prolificans TaxID=41688 RepID=A0A2N3NGZ7_9PEZI|nr:hypothetical protein jhhlp_001735 [Lomentospora prolificans]
MEWNKKQDRKLSMVVVMGVTGAGKSYFINRLAGQGKDVTKEGDSLYSCTKRCLPIPVIVGGAPILIIDTPGFDDPEISDSDILTEISRILVAQYKLGMELKGIIYLHRITDVRFTGSSVKAFNILQRICGEESFRSVLLTTSGWSGMDEETGSRREGELRDGFWAYTLGRGAHMSRFHGTRDSAIMLISQLLRKKPVILKMQQELIDNGKELKDTAAGAYLYNRLEVTKEEHRQMLALLEERKEKSEEAGSKTNQTIEAEIDLQSRHFRAATNQQDNLSRRIVDDVDQELRRQSGRRGFRNFFPIMLPFLSIVLNILFGLLGIPAIRYLRFSSNFHEEPNREWAQPRRSQGLRLQTPKTYYFAQQIRIGVGLENLLGRNVQF